MGQKWLDQPPRHKRRSWWVYRPLHSESAWALQRQPPTEAVLIEAGKNKRWETLTAKYMIKCRPLLNGVAIKRNGANMVWRLNDIICIQTSTFHPDRRSCPKVHREAVGNQKAIMGQWISLTAGLQIDIKVFTDGAAGKNYRAEAAFVVPENENEVVSLPRQVDNTSPTTCEMVSIYH